MILEQNKAFNYDDVATAKVHPINRLVDTPIQTVVSFPFPSKLQFIFNSMQPTFNTLMHY